MRSRKVRQCKTNEIFPAQSWRLVREIKPLRPRTKSIRLLVKSNREQWGFKKAMSENSKIQWTDHTVNFVIGCVKVDELCTNCYADELDDFRFSKTLGGGTKEAPIRHWGLNAPRYLRIDQASKELIALNRKARAAGRVDKVFINSLSDTFEDRADLSPARAALFVMVAACENLIFQILTKRPENVRRMVPAVWLVKWPTNAWIGTSVGNSESADERLPELLKIPAPLRFLSMEPLLDEVSLGATDATWSRGIHWVIVGGESGSNARKFDLNWAQIIISDCRLFNIPCFVKQLGAFPVCSNANLFDWPDSVRLEPRGTGFAECRVKLRDKKGGDMAEWPEGLRVREFPKFKSPAPVAAEARRN